MKKFATISLCVIISLAVHSQNRTLLSSELRDKTQEYHSCNIEAPGQVSQSLKPLNYRKIKDSQVIGNTYYDYQTKGSMPPYINYFNDGTIGAIWMMGFNYTSYFDDRGTGYNYYNGNDWESSPTVRLESVKTGWPSYNPFGSNGEIFFSHDFSSGDLIFLKRNTKGAGLWLESIFTGPSGVKIGYSRSTTSGINKSVIHILALSHPIATGGSLYQGLDGALLYSRSYDGGLSWDQNNIILDGMTSAEYNGIQTDSYALVSKGDHIAFLVGSPWVDLFLMKSTDNGNSWTKTIIWEHPYPLFNPNAPFTTEAFFCADGSHSLCFDQNMKIHVAFGINKTYSTDYGTFWYPAIGGIGYWNEDMPVFTNNINALNPYGGTGSELIEDYNLIGWTQDVNGNNIIDVLNDWGYYYLGFSSMPQLVIDDQNNMFVVFSSVTEGYDNGTQNYRHLWARGYNNTIESWGEFIDLNSDILYENSECIYPSCSPTLDDKIHMIFMEDDDPGLAVISGIPFGNNNIRYLGISKALFGFYLEAKLYLEGPYNGTDMNTSLNTQGYLPLLQPYNMTPWNYEGAESVPVIPNSDVVDWVLLELRDTTEAAFATESSVIARKAAFLLNDGRIVDRDGISIPFFSTTIADSLFVVIIHRNHLEVKTANPAKISGNTYSTDLTIGEDQFYGGKYSCAELSPGIWGAISANGVHDSQINNLDKNDQWYVEVGLSGYYQGDFDMNGIVDNNDRIYKLNNNLGKGKPDPD